MSVGGGGQNGWVVSPKDSTWFDRNILCTVSDGINMNVA